VKLSGFQLPTHQKFCLLLLFVISMLFLSMLDWMY